MSFEKLNIGDKYSKKDLSLIFENPNIKLIREGIYNLSDSESFFFVDLEKKDKEKRFHFDDFFEEDFFHWDSQTTQHINTPKIKEIINGQRTPHLFIRLTPKVKNVTQPFIYCGRLKYSMYEDGTSNPVHIVFENIDYQYDTNNEDLIKIYGWTPRKIGKTTKTTISKKGFPTTKKNNSYKKPNKTERKGLVTSRIGQGYYRQKVREKWNYQCPITKCNNLKILIASHIVAWSESNDRERLDVENGILLSPNVDALFDRHLISFSDNGEIILSKHINFEEINRLGIDLYARLEQSKITPEMKKYLSRHREKLEND